VGKDKNDAEGALTNPSLADPHLSRIRGEGLPVGRCVDSVLIMRLNTFKVLCDWAMQSTWCISCSTLRSVGGFS